MRGPYVFATGALQVMSRQLVSHVFLASVTREFAERASLEREELWLEWGGLLTIPFGVLWLAEPQCAMLT